MAGMTQLKQHRQTPRAPARDGFAWTEPLLAEAAALWAAGASVGAIARHYRISRNVVGGVIRRNRDRFPARAAGERRGARGRKAAPARHRDNPRPGGGQGVDARDGTVEDSEPVLLAERSPRQCAFPLWGSLRDPVRRNEKDFDPDTDRYCGAPTAPGRAYCAAHRRRMFREPGRRDAPRG